jgi:sRNA-binding carbon storage regulator CsrA
MALSLTRKNGESLVLTLQDGTSIRITLDIRKHEKGNKYCLVLDAPKEVKIDREEMLKSQE